MSLVIPLVIECFCFISPSNHEGHGDALQCQDGGITELKIERMTSCCWGRGPLIQALWCWEGMFYAGRYYDTIDTEEVHLESNSRNTICL